MILTVGIDIGSTYTKAVMMDDTKQIRATAIRRSGYKPASAAAAVYDESQRWDRYWIHLHQSRDDGRHKAGTRYCHS